MLPLLYLGCAITLNAVRQHEIKTNPAFWKESIFKIDSRDEALICVEEEEGQEACQTIIAEGSGSGFAVKSKIEKGKTHILTAAHICSMEMNPAFPPRITNISDSITRKLVVTDGVSRWDAKIVEESITHDLCVLEIEAEIKYKLDISDVGPAYAERIYNIGAPRGFWEAGVKMFNEGFYSGVVLRQTEDGVNYIEQIFSIPAVGGLSGSPIITQDGKVVGMIQAVRLDYPWITFSCDLESMRRIIKAAQNKD